MKIEIDEKYLRVKITSPDGGFIEKQSVEAVLLARLLQVLEGNLTQRAPDLANAPVLEINTDQLKLLKKNAEGYLTAADGDTADRGDAAGKGD